MMNLSELLEKYDKPIPRYTSYPTTPYWQSEPPTQEAWIATIRQSIQKQNEISLYIHLPFCEKLCTYCGCNKRITKNHGVEHPYLNSLLQEWEIYLQNLPVRPILRELHLGGGTPTFFQASNLRFLLERILDTVDVAQEHSFGFEAHPNNTTSDHLETLRALGFNRISLGVQDFSTEIMEGINRRQEVADVVRVTEQARSLGYTSINYDLIFGLPFQQTNHIQNNIEWIRKLQPDRIAYYSYAHVPWKQANQRGFTESDLARGAEKKKLYEMGEAAFSQMGYGTIAMDHFALPSDSLFEAYQNKTLHRNFMGYTPFKTDVLIGLGASAISDSWSAFVQNERKVEDYQQRLSEGVLPVIKGHLLSEEDQVLRRHILNIMCHYETNWASPDLQTPALEHSLLRLAGLVQDNLVRLSANQMEVTPVGKSFIRNIALCFDARYWKDQPQEALFSHSI